MTSRLCFGLVVSALLVTAGCSDDSSDNGDGGSAGSGGTGGAGASGGSSGSSGSGGGSGGSTGGSAGASTGGTAGSSGSAGGTSTGGSGGGAAGSGGGSPTGGVQCGAVICDLSQHQCCAYYNQPAKCVATAPECLYGVDVLCDGPEDCASGQVCCGQMFVQGKNKAYDSFTCAASCNAPDQRVICGSSGSCPSGTCGPSELLPEYNDCK